MTISTGSHPQFDARQSSHNPFGPRRSTSVHSLHQSFQLPALSLNSTPTLKKLSAKFFHRKPSSSVSSISTGPITTATSLSPTSSEPKLVLPPDANSPIGRHSNLPQLVTRQSSAVNKSNVSAQSIKSHNPTATKGRSASVIAITTRSTPSFSSLSQSSQLRRQSSHQQPFAMDDDPDYHQNLSQSATPNTKSKHVSHISANIVQIPSTPATPLEKPEFQTEYARQLFRGTADHRRYTPHEDEDEELAHPSSGSELDPIQRHPSSRSRASHGSISSLGRFNINTTSSTVISQDASSEQSHSPHLASHQPPSFRRPTSSTSAVSPFLHPALSSSQTPAVNSVLDGRNARPNSTFRSSVRRKVDGFKVGIKLLKPSRIPVDEANCLVPADDASESWGHDCQHSLDFDEGPKSRQAIPSFSLQPKNIVNEAPLRAPNTVNRAPARPLSVRNSINRHLSASRGSPSPTPSHQYSQAKFNDANSSNRDHIEPMVASENDAFAVGQAKPNIKALPNSQPPPPTSLRLRPGRMPLQSLDLDYDSRDRNPVFTPQLRQGVNSVSNLHRSISSSALQSPEGLVDFRKGLGEPQNTGGPEPTLQAGCQGAVPASQISVHRRRSPIIHESSNDLRRQIAREVNSNGLLASQRTYSDARPPSSIRVPSGTLGALNPSKNSIQRPSDPNEPIVKASSSKYGQSNPLYQQHPQQYLQSHNNSSEQNSSHRRPHHSGQFSVASQSNHGHPQIPVTPAGPPSQRASKYQTPNLNYRWSSSALSSTAQQRQRVERRPQPFSQSPVCGENEESEEDDEIASQSQVPSRNPQLLSNQRQFYVREDERPAQNEHLRVPANDEPDHQIRKHSFEPNRMDKNSIVVNNVEYTRQCVIGRGGSSKVFRAGMKDGSPKLVAIKVVGLKQSDNQTYLTFCNEIELLRRLRGNDRIINLIDSAMDDVRRKVWLVMELGETDLNQLLNRQLGKPISFRFIKHIWEQMLQAVQAVHDQEIIHTDLKPANFVLVQGSVKIIDFGIAKAIPADTTNISRDTQIGTANYMSPEALIMQQFGDRQTVKMGRATDVWALGCILYQMIYGHTPFSKLDTSLKVHTIRDPKHVIDYPESVTPVEVTSEGKQVMLHEHKVVVEKEAISTMKGCLTYNKEQRPEIPDLLKHAFLLGPSPGTSTPSNNPPGKITIPSSMVDDIVHKAWDWYSRKTANGNRVSESQKRKFVSSIKDSILSSQ